MYPRPQEEEMPLILHHPPSKALPNKLFKEVLDRKQSRRDILITHSARTVTFVGGRGRSLDYISRKSGKRG